MPSTSGAKIHMHTARAHDEAVGISRPSHRERIAIVSRGAQMADIRDRVRFRRSIVKILRGARFAQVKNSNPSSTPECEPNPDARQL